MSADEIGIVLLSLKVAALAVLLVAPFAVFFAWVLARRNFPGKSLLDAAIHLPLVLPPVAVGYGLLLVFGRQGPVGRVLDELLGVQLAFAWEGAALAAAVMALPLAVRPIRLALETVDTRLELAARTLGATRRDAFLSVTLPLCLPGIVAALVLGFARALGEFGATITFVSNIPGETRTLPLAMHTLLEVPDGEAGALRLAIFSIVLSLAALMAAEYLNRRLRRRLGGVP